MSQPKDIEFEQRSDFIHSEEMKLEYEMRDAAEQDIRKQFEYLWEKFHIGETTQQLIEPLKELALQWYTRGRFNE